MSAITIEAAVEVPVVTGTASPGNAASVNYSAAVNRAGNANTDVGPWSGSPKSIHRTSANPSDSSFWTKPSVRYRSPSVKPIFSRLGRNSTQAQSANHHHRTQHPILHATHNPSVAAGHVTRSESKESEIWRPARLHSD
jgi:hypothetical protein